MATGGLGESSNQVHGDEFHGHRTRPEIVLDVLCLFHLLLCTHLAVFAMHEDIFLHSFPVVQLLECCICSPESIMCGPKLGRTSAVCVVTLLEPLGPDLIPRGCQLFVREKPPSSTQA